MPDSKKLLLKLHKFECHNVPILEIIEPAALNLMAFILVYSSLKKIKLKIFAIELCN